MRAGGDGDGDAFAFWLSLAFLPLVSIFGGRRIPPDWLAAQAGG